MPTLIGLPISPATERARWALDYAAVPYRFEEYLPGVTTPWVRLRTRRLFGSLSVPILLGPGLNLPDSWDIACHAAQQQPAAGLMPPAQRSQIEQLNQISEKLFYAGRILALERMLNSDAASLKLIPPMFPSVLHKALLPLIHKTNRELRKKYADPDRSNADQLRLIAELLTQIRQQLNGKPFLLESGFSYADITIIAALQVVKPAQSQHIPMGPAMRPCWTCDDLTKEFADVLAWRDGVDQQYRYRDHKGVAVSTD